MTQQLTPIDTEKLIIMSHEQFEELFLHLAGQIIVSTATSVCIFVSMIFLAEFLVERLFDFMHRRREKEDRRD